MAKDKMKGVKDSPKWTNPYIGMVALTSGVINRFGTEGRKVLTESFRHLGRRTGQYMVDEGLIRKGVSVHDWGILAIQLLDLTGIYNHQVVEDTEDRFAIRVENCGYIEPYEYLSSPPDVCRIQIEWDAGCLETVNPDIHFKIEKCIYSGDPYCLYVVEKTSK